MPKLINPVSSISGSAVIGALPSGSLAVKASNANMYLPITLFAKSASVLTAGAPADIATMTVPAGITRYLVQGNSSITAPGMMVTETQSGTMAAGTMAMFDGAGGTGTQLLATTAPPATATPTLKDWDASASALMSTSGTLSIRQMVNSANAGTISFYITIVPIP